MEQQQQQTKTMPIKWVDQHDEEINATSFVHDVLESICSTWRHQTGGCHITVHKIGIPTYEIRLHFSEHELRITYRECAELIFHRLRTNALAAKIVLADAGADADAAASRNNKKRARQDEHNAYMSIVCQADYTHLPPQFTQRPLVWPARSGHVVRQKKTMPLALNNILVPENVKSVVDSRFCQRLRTIASQILLIFNPFLQPGINQNETFLSSTFRLQIASIEDRDGGTSSSVCLCVTFPPQIREFPVEWMGELCQNAPDIIWEIAFVNATQQLEIYCCKDSPYTWRPTTCFDGHQQFDAQQNVIDTITGGKTAPHYYYRSGDEDFTQATRKRQRRQQQQLLNS